MSPPRLQYAPNAPAAVAGTAGWRGVLAPPAVALLTLITALVATDAAGVSFRDPDNVAVGYVAMVGPAVALLVGVDIWLRARGIAGTWRPQRAVLRAVQRERWTRSRGMAVACALVSF